MHPHCAAAAILHLFFYALFYQQPVHGVCCEKSDDHGYLQTEVQTFRLDLANKAVTALRTDYIHGAGALIMD